MMRNSVVINEKDNVAITIESVEKGTAIQYASKTSGTVSVTALDDFVIYHKVAITEIEKGRPVVKYGENIGLASRDIHVGEHVHVHNVESHREDL